jgi:tRNA threonylcarbamoyladenosine biosynthesis protein TsaB
MRVLALDTTTRAGSVAVAGDGRVLVERAGDALRTHAERLPGELLDALSAAGLSASDIDLFAVASGPGSFTGLRIGIATIQGIAFVHRKAVAPISALRALAEVAAHDVPVGARVGAWMDAHRRDVFSALYEIIDPSRGAGPSLRELEGPLVGPPVAALERWSTIGMPRVICGDGATTYQALVPEDVRVVAAPPLASIICRLAIDLAASGHTVSPAGVQPVYVRRPDAEVARDAASLKR